ncbi:hypothetical protein RM572_13205 [Streptomyces sp. DSM 42041]|uniref:Uncharacterized protein n=1 Tax=Streptomyces hazeniae TaxID=3075538 RepID=A0ABU2NRW9_9ACTN|nr:hypothetical protein [Streptomyces sp. DSM 42041]MDT0379725.1 hypothetical protein [Streptomyces sp. DSM 42041]
MRGGGGYGGAWATRTAAVAVGAVLMPAVTAGQAGAAPSDAAHTGSHNVPRVALVHTGRTDDPLEDVLEHASLLHSRR